jgi:hypothetical protein
MKAFRRLFVLFTIAAFSPLWGGNVFPHQPGNFFIREKVSNFKAFKKAFDGQRDNLKNSGFSAYSLHRDLRDKQFLILTLKCSDLCKGMEFIGSNLFQEAMARAGVGKPVIWSGMDILERHYSDRPRIGDGSGIVIAENRVKDYAFWKKCWDAEGHHNHPGRGYKNGNYSISRLKTDPETVIVAHEASDVSKAPAFMNSPSMRGVVDSVGVVHFEVWYGVSLEEGVF